MGNFEFNINLISVNGEDNRTDQKESYGEMLMFQNNRRLFKHYSKLLYTMANGMPPYDFPLGPGITLN